MELEPTPRFEWERLLRRVRCDPSVKFVGFMMASYGTKEGGSIFPGVDRLADVTGYSERCVKDALAELRRIGMIERVFMGGGRSGKADVHRLTRPVDMLERVPMLGPDEEDPEREIKREKARQAELDRKRRTHAAKKAAKQGAAEGGRQGAAEAPADPPSDAPNPSRKGSGKGSRMGSPKGFAEGSANPREDVASPPESAPTSGEASGDLHDDLMNPSGIHPERCAESADEPMRDSDRNAPGADESERRADECAHGAVSPHGVGSEPSTQQDNLADWSLFPQVGANGQSVRLGEDGSPADRSTDRSTDRSSDSEGVAGGSWSRTRTSSSPRDGLALTCGDAVGSGQADPIYGPDGRTLSGDDAGQGGSGSTLPTGTGLPLGTTLPVDAQEQVNSLPETGELSSGTGELSSGNRSPQFTPPVHAPQHGSSQRDHSASKEAGPPNPPKGGTAAVAAREFQDKKIDDENEQDTAVTPATSAGGAAPSPSLPDWFPADLDGYTEAQVAGAYAQLVALTPEEANAAWREAVMRYGAKAGRVRLTVEAAAFAATPRKVVAA